MKRLLLLITFLFPLYSANLVFGQDSVEVVPSDSLSGLPLVIQPTLVEFEELFSAGKVISIVFVLIITFLGVRLITFLLEKLAENQISYRLFIKRLIPFINVSIWSFAIFFIIAGIINPPIETVLTVGASVGLAVGFASQDILKNIFGGFIIILDRPFQVGDKIQVDNYYGEVTSIGLRSTRIITPDDSLVSLPNANLVSNAVSNSNSGALYCQVVASIFLPTSANLDAVKEIAYKAAISSRYLYLNKPVVVVSENRVVDRNPVIELKIKAYVLDIRYEFLLKSDITDLIIGELNRRNLLAPQATQAES